MNLFNNIDLSKPSRLGLIYQGSKTKINYDLFQVMHEKAPYANYFYDLFGGGGGMSFNAHQYGYKVFYNELYSNTYQLIEYLCSRVGKRGKYGMLDNECYEWVGRAKFNQIKVKEIKSPIDILKLNIYSFGCDGNTYFCNSDKEAFKEQGHYFVLDNAKNSACYIYDYLITRAMEFKTSPNIANIILQIHNEVYPKLESYTDRREIFANMILKIEGSIVGGVSDKVPQEYEGLKAFKLTDIVRLINEYNPNVPIKHYKSNKKYYPQATSPLSEVKQLEQLEQLQRLQQLEQLEQLQRLQRLEQLEQLELTNLSYNEVDITTPPDETIIYCDPPYRGTNTTAYGKDFSFDYEAFYEFLQRKHDDGYNVFISEYDMPEPFKCVWQREVLNNKSNKAKNRVEKLFIL